MGKLIIIEGLDGSGKSTQLERLYQTLRADGTDCRQVSFPDYEHPSSTLVKMYLNGDFGQKPTDVNAYAASTLYAVDRFASYKQYWGSYYENGGLVLAGRYTTSNAVHQCGKMEKHEWKDFLDWLYDFEYVKVGIPKPDSVIFLDMPIEVSQQLLSKRYHGHEEKKDIHERNTTYLSHCREAALFAAEYSGWQIIPCAEDGQARSIGAIAKDVFCHVKAVCK